MDKEMLEQFQLIHQSLINMERKIDDTRTGLEAKIKESEARTRLLIENKVTSRIDALVDGYQTVHEKQWELEHKTEQLQQQIEDLQVRMAVLEEKTA